jgi:hypothetical protein
VAVELAHTLAVAEHSAVELVEQVVAETLQQPQMVTAEMEQQTAVAGAELVHIQVILELVATVALA